MHQRRKWMLITSCLPTKIASLKIDAKIDSIEAFLKRDFFVFDFKDKLVKAYFHI